MTIGYNPTRARCASSCSAAVPARRRRPQPRSPLAAPFCTWISSRTDVGQLRRCVPIPEQVLLAGPFGLLVQPGCQLRGLCGFRVLFCATFLSARDLEDRRPGGHHLPGNCMEGGQLLHPPQEKRARITMADVPSPAEIHDCFSSHQDDLSNMGRAQNSLKPPPILQQTHHHTWLGLHWLRHWIY